MDTENAKQLVKLADDLCTDHFIPGVTDVLFFTFQIHVPYCRLAPVCLPERKDRSHHGRQRFSL